MGKIILVTGGARSGKSSFAESLFSNIKDVVYIATARIYDDEMRDRVRLHRQSRPKEWATFEGTYNLAEGIENKRNCLLDCLTVMTSNIMFDITGDKEIITLELQKQVEDKVIKEIEKLILEIRKRDGTLVIVTNEVGCSIVPESHVARVYRDIIGRVNQKTAAMAEEVYLVTCGLPFRIK